MEQILVLAALLALCCLLLHTEGLMTPGGGSRTGVVLLLLAAFGARYFLLDRCPCAGEDAVRDAISYFREAGGFWGLRSYRGDFSVPVQYCLALSACARKGSLYIFKYICFFGDVVLSWGCQRCVSAVTVKDRPRRGVFLLTLVLPSLLLQSCAGLGTGLRWIFPVLAAAGALRGSFRLCAVMLGLSAAFDPAALWLLPMFWVFPALRQNTARSLPWMIGAYFVILLPALLLGRPAGITLPFWPRIDLSTGTAAVNALPFFTLSRPAGIGIWAALAALTLYRLSGRDAIHDRRRQLGGVCLAALAAGAILPGGAAAALLGGEVLTVTLSFLDAGMIPAAACAVFASSLSLATEVFPGLIPLPLWWSAAALLIAMAILLGYVLFKRN